MAEEAAAGGGLRGARVERARAGSERALRRSLEILMGARLGLALLSLGIALALEAAGGTFTAVEWRGFYGTVALAFLATLSYGIAQRRVRRWKRFAAINVLTDIGIVSALVHFSGGPDSAFTFLYVIVGVYGAMLFPTGAALGAAAFASLAYGSVLLAEYRGWLGGSGLSGPLEPTVLVGTWAVHAAAVALVATLAGVLSAELRRTGEALHRRTSDLVRLQSLHQRTVESLMSGLLTTDGAGRVTSCNPEAERITGVPAAEAIGQEVEQVLPGIGEVIRESTGEAPGPRSRARIPFRDTRGALRHLGAAAYVLRDAEGEGSGHVVIFQDVTQVVSMERDLRRSERLAAVGQLSASIAHEIRNPLASISGSIQVLRDRFRAPGAGDDPAPLMDIVVRETDRLNRLITDFLHYARPGPRNLEPVRVARAVEEVLEMFEAARPPGLALEVEVEEELAVWADAAQLQQVLWNLVLNASEAMGEDGLLRIRAAATGEGPPPQELAGAGRNEAQERKKRWVEVSVEDRGEGIPPETLERVFDPFFTTKKQGSGLGLATVHRIVEDHGGSVRVESRVGEGTAVRVRLPGAEAPA